MTRKTSIAIFTEFYPYGNGEEFLQDELLIAEKFFEKILIVSFRKPPLLLTKYLPSNVELLPIRESMSNTQLQIERVISFFSLDFWKQVVLSIKERGIRDIKETIISVILEQSKIRILKHNEYKWAGKFDIFYSYWLAGSASYLAIRKPKLDGLVISRAHGYDCFYDRGYHSHRKEQFNSLDMIFPISEAGRLDLIKQGCTPDKIHTAHLGVIQLDNNLKPYIQTDKKIIVTCSNIVDLKRLDLLINALSKIDNINIHWIHFGDGVLREIITALAQTLLGSKENISYEFKGWVQKKEILDYYKDNQIDLFINCSDAEGIPVSIMEAMSFGIPCIARDVGGNSEIVSENNGKLLGSKGCVDELKTSINDILSLTESEILALRKTAYNTFKEKFNAVSNYTSFFEEMV